MVDPTSKLPPGLTIAAATGNVTGTPTAVGVYSVQLTVKDSTTTRSATISFTWTITYPPIAATNPGTMTSTVSTPVNVQLTATGGSGSYTWTGGATLPLGLSMNSNGLITLSPTSTGTTAVSLTVTDNLAGYQQTVAFTWNVVAQPTIAAPGTKATTEGASPSYSLAYTCPNAPCTVTLSGTVPGLGLSTSAVNNTNNTTTSIGVSGTSGTVYINGIVQSNAVPTGNSAVYAPTVTITDAAGAVVSPAAGAWTIYVPPTITAPGSQATAPSAAISLQIVASCPNGGCTYAGTRKLISTGTTTALTIDSTGKITYAAGMAAGVYTVIVTVTDAASVQATATFTWTVAAFALSIPDQASTKPASGTTIITVNINTWLSPTATGYTFTPSGFPSWLTINSAGVLTATLTSSSATDNSISITVTSNASATSTVTDSFKWTIS